MHDIVDKLNGLPGRAVVAFAARCAERVQPLYMDRIPGSQPVMAINAIGILIHALNCAENYASRDAYDDTLPGTVHPDQRANVLIALAAFRDIGDPAAISAAEASASAFGAAVAALQGKRKNSIAEAAMAASQASNAAFLAAGAPSRDKVDRLIDLDLKAILSLVSGVPSDEDPTVDPDIEGPLGELWPNGEPEWYTPSLTNDPQASPALPGMEKAEPDIVLVWDPEVLDERRYAQLIALLGDVVRAEGGAGVERIRSMGLGLPCGAGVRQ